MPRCSKIKQRPDAQLLQTVMLRSLRQAMYSPTTSVTWPGLRALHAFHLADSPLPGSAGPSFDQGRAQRRTLQPGSWDDIGLNCSMTERRADEATRDVDNWLKCYYMKERIGEEFDGTIAAVVPFGVFVALDSVYVEGLVHVGTGRGLSPVRQRQHQMLGERSGKRYRLGDRLRVKLVKADPGKRPDRDCRDFRCRVRQPGCGGPKSSQLPR